MTEERLPLNRLDAAMRYINAWEAIETSIVDADTHFAQMDELRAARDAWHAIRNDAPPPPPAIDPEAVWAAAIRWATAEYSTGEAVMTNDHDDALRWDQERKIARAEVRRLFSLSDDAEGA